MRRNFPHQLGQMPGRQNDSERDELLLGENDQTAEDLKKKIGTLKSLTIDIGNEVRYQDKLLRGLDDEMDRTSGFLSNTINRVVRLGKNGSCRQTFILVLFILFIFLLLYFVIKLK